MQSPSRGARLLAELTAAFQSLSPVQRRQTLGALREALEHCEESQPARILCNPLADAASV